MKLFETPDIKVTTFGVEDVITASGNDQCNIVGYAPDSDDSEFG